MCHPAAWSFSLAKSTCYIAKVKATCHGLHVLVMVGEVLCAACSEENLYFMASWNESLLFQMFSFSCVCPHLHAGACGSHKRVSDLEGE